MDPTLQNSNDHAMAPLSTPSTSRKRERDRENETPSQRHKRVMAAERQRRKRERDRNNSLSQNGNITSIGKTNGPSNPVFSSPSQQLIPHPAPPPPESNNRDEDDLSPDEKARRERVRAAARERQRKHRALVKDRKMRELGLDMGNEITEVHYPRDGQYLMPHELDQQQQQRHELDQQHEEIVQPEPPYPQGQPSGGLTFASTLLLSFSCAPLLKQHLLRTLQMSNEELASLEPILAEAYDRWNHQVRTHHALLIYKMTTRILNGYSGKYNLHNNNNLLKLRKQPVPHPRLRHPQHTHTPQTTITCPCPCQTAQRQTAVV